MNIERTMFREYDIRGMVNNRELNEESMQKIARSFSIFLKKRNVRECVVGHDCREYSPGLQKAFLNELLSCGINVVDIGMVLTPMTYFSQYYLGVKGCAMITASHNPNGWCGVKLGHDFSTTLGPSEIKEILNNIDKEAESKSGILKKEDIFESYKRFVLSKICLKKGLKIVIDCGNGTAGPIVPDIFRSAGCEVIEQYCNIDTTFPNHEPNPASLDTMEALGKKVREAGAYLGLAFDGDGDRLGVCDEKGDVVWPDRILILLSRLVLEKNPGAKIVYDVKCTQALDEDIRAHRGIPVMWKTGHSHIKSKLKTDKALLAGERSGHIFFVDGYYGYDDAVVTIRKLPAS